jgi:threonylcarbamoyladenosine tRNA methylthiotransferase MtaB
VNARGFHTVTLGCKLNRFDTAVIEGQLARRGFHPETDASRASVVIVNTCTVTGKADAEARRRIRGLRRDNPGCRLLVTGCYAELDAEAIRAIDGVDYVFGNRDKPRLGRILDALGIGEGGPAPGGAHADRGCDAALELPRALHFGDRARAFLKVQEGCRLACSYCIIPTVRGPSRSVPPDEIERAALELFDAGYREIVLTGVNVGDYGRDLARRTSLASLLGRLLAVAGPNRVRLNSLEPLTVTDEIVELMASDPRLAPHLQVPLQSGSPAILRAMRRNYRVEDYLERLRRLRDAVPRVGLGADVIVGFPGETDARFRETYELIEASPLNYLHVFAWSPRPGTPAAGLPDRVRGDEVRRRSAALRLLADERSHRFRAGFVGRRLDAVVLAPREDGRVRALTGNYIEVALDPGTAVRGEVVRARVESVTRDDTRAVVDGRPSWARDRGGRAAV